jgi:tRNA (guanine-N7-)-methyltransferase
LVQHYLAPHSVSEIHCYHPQPFYDPREVHRRLITPTFLSLVHRCLVPGGLFFIQTDNPGYWRYIREVVPIYVDFHERIGKWPDGPKGRTRREIIALRRGLPIFRGSGTAKLSLDEEAAVQLAEEMPLPMFDSDRRLRQLDEDERR